MCLDVGNKYTSHEKPDRMMLTWKFLYGGWVLLYQERMFFLVYNSERIDNMKYTLVYIDNFLIYQGGRGKYPHVGIR